MARLVIIHRFTHNFHLITLPNNIMQKEQNGKEQQGIGAIEAFKLRKCKK